ncbi:MAG: DUF3455 domain-containing protein [Byssovorax sp.]
MTLALVNPRSLLLLLSASLLAGCTSNQPAPAPPETPDALKVPAGQTLVLEAAAEGVQIYTCQAAEGAPEAFAWTLKAPEATLSNQAREKIGTHSAGPTWALNDGSKLTGAVKAKADAPDSSAIPWLLLEKKSTEGTGAFGKVTFIQRVHTAQGKAPAAGCDAAHAGAETRVAYTADYYFYAP